MSEPYKNIQEIINDLNAIQSINDIQIIHSLVFDATENLEESQRQGIVIVPNTIGSSVKISELTHAITVADLALKEFDERFGK